MYHVLTIVLILSLAPAVSATGGDYQINTDTALSWTDSVGTITLSANNDTLTLLADSGPDDATYIFVTAPDNSEVTIIGQGGVTYENLYIMVQKK